MHCTYYKYKYKYKYIYIYITYVHVCVCIYIYARCCLHVGPLWILNLTMTLPRVQSRGASGFRLSAWALAPGSVVHRVFRVQGLGFRV